jgi:hypothetical protein
MRPSIHVFMYKLIKNILFSFTIQRSKEIQKPDHTSSNAAAEKRVMVIVPGLEEKILHLRTRQEMGNDCQVGQQNFQELELLEETL